MVAVVKADRYEAGIVHWIYAGDTALHVAAAGYRVEIATLLLAAAAEVNRAGNRRRSRPLHYAADGSSESPAWEPARQVAMLRLLIENGADLHAQDRNGATALHRAVRTRCAAAVRYLLENGADPQIRNLPGSTAFHLAVQDTGWGGSGSDESRSAQREILREFLAHGVSLKLKDARGRSVLAAVRTDWVRQCLRSA